EAGWYVAPGGFDTPDLLKVSMDKPRYRIGETAKARIEPRFPGLALVMVLDDRLIAMTPVEVPEEGATVELPVTTDWGPGAYVTAVLFRPMDISAKRMPARAIGLTWAGVDPQERELDVKLAVTEKTRPRGPLDVSVAIGSAKAGEEIYLTVAAVDAGILNLTRYEAPAPDKWYFGQRRLGIEIRDLYGQLIDRMQGVPGIVRSGGDGPLMRLEGPPPTQELVSFYSGIRKVGEDGRATLSFDVPDFNGTVRVMAMAWSRKGVGHAVRDVIVRDPVVVSAALPRFLAPGDRSRLLIDLAHVEGPAGDMVLTVETSGVVAVDAVGASRRIPLPERARRQVLVPIEAVAVGDDRMTIRLTTPDGQVFSKVLSVPVRSNEPPVVRSSVVALTPGGQGLTVSADLLADLVPGTGSVLVSVSGAGRLDVAGVIRALDRYPYGCSEQLTSRALPLLYLDKLALSVGLEGDGDAGDRVKELLAGVLAKQSSGGGFGLWGAGGDDLWLDAYVTDFLTRAREQGYEVPVVAFDMALDNLRNRLSYAPDFQSGGQDIAYALYVLARNGRANIGDLRYYAEAKRDAFATPLAKAQIGAALALYGDRLRGDALFRSALAMLQEGDDPGGWRSDYGSALRDGAAILTLAGETGSAAVDIPVLASRLEEQWEQTGFTSTQEKAWMLLAAHALMEGAAKPRLAVDGGQVEGAFYRSLDAASLASAPVTIRNLGDQPTDATVLVSGVPTAPE
ncbi:MAG: alpha-2-macroglobulin family protein, partial [Pseudomonadota bacterium]|nr:alpha-2-macroglobulin family protein [Pseudomonadota bacterium]